MNEIDFHGKNVLVVGGSSGIGNGIARVFRDHSANVFISGTRVSASDYKDEEGTDLSRRNRGRC
jgi:3-oxoacyl-[acyl-carrier protein] reductase